MSKSPWILLCLLVGLVACRTPPATGDDSGAPGTASAPENASATAAHGQHEAPSTLDEPAAHPAPSAAESKTATASTPTTAPSQDQDVAPNRDKHGNANVEKYIATLQSDTRVAELKVDVVIAKLALPPDAVVGDLGCGPGVFTIAFAKACPDGIVYASDVEPRQLDVVRERIHAEKLVNVVPVLASYDDPHFPPERLDVVFIADTYHHLEDRITYMKRLANVLRPGGRLVILDYKPGKLPVGPGPEHKLPAGVMEQEMAAAGYKRVASYDTHPYQDFEVWRVVQGWEKK